MPEPRPAATRLAAVVLVGLEALAVIAVGMAEAISASSERLGLAISSAAFFLILGAAILVGVRGLWRRERWSRGPLVFIQLIQLGIASSFRDEPTTWVAVLLAATAVLALVCLLAPATSRDLPDDQPSESPDESVREQPPS